MGRITIDMTINAPVATVFAYVDDYRNTTKYMKDLVKWQPTGRVTHGKGARFDVGMKAGPTTLSSVVDITTWLENKAIGWDSNEGFKQIGLWAFKPKGDKTQVTFDMEYEFGGGIAGRLLGRAAEPIVRGNLQRSVETLKLHTEKIGAPRSVAKAAAKSNAHPAAKSATRSAPATTKPATKTTTARATGSTKSATKPAPKPGTRAKNSSKNA
jgi:uncharacterized membrane protein